MLILDKRASNRDLALAKDVVLEAAARHKRLNVTRLVMRERLGTDVRQPSVGQRIPAFLIFGFHFNLFCY